ncbi:MAG: pantoate--beta-alanine ligase [Pseudomonadota bacterium]
MSSQKTKNTNAPTIGRTLPELRAATGQLRQDPQVTLALVPTMGALHAGHIELVKHAHTVATHVAVSIFVNPTQFAPTEDLGTYPRTEAADLEILKAEGVNLVWVPGTDTMYPTGFSSAVQPAKAAESLETDHRPHFFQGVTTVVAKLFNQVRPDAALFGEKDYQQLCVIRAMVRDLDFGIDIVGVPTVRENDGLALSSRNAYLTTEERQAAPSLHEALQTLSKSIAVGTPIEEAKANAKALVLERGFRNIDYIEVRDAETLSPYEPRSDRPGRILAAAWLGNTRLIDNIPL